MSVVYIYTRRFWLQVFLGIAACGVGMFGGVGVHSDPFISHRGPGSAALGHPWPPRHLHILCFIVPPSAVRTTHSRIQKKATRWVTSSIEGQARPLSAIRGLRGICTSCASS